MDAMTEATRKQLAVIADTAAALADLKALETNLEQLRRSIASTRLTVDKSLETLQAQVTAALKEVHGAEANLALVRELDKLLDPAVVEQVRNAVPA